MSSPGAGVTPASPPSLVVAVKALACELPARRGVPLSRWSVRELQREVITQGLVAESSGTTIWRWLSQDALCPWRYRSWLCPRDPEFLPKAGLDLYAGVWQGQPLTPQDHVLCADEKTRIQARRRCHPSVAPTAGRVRRVEHEYERGGALAYLAAWDVRHARVFGRCEARTGIAPFDCLVADVMSREPYRSAARVFWVLDNGSAHRGARAVERLPAAWPTLIPVGTPIHASWLNQIEIYFSIVQRKVPTPNEFDNLEAVAERLLPFQTRYEQMARPFEWKFTRPDLVNVLARYSEVHEAAA